IDRSPMKLLLISLVLLGYAAASCKREAAEGSDVCTCDIIKGIKDCKICNGCVCRPVLPIHFQFRAEPTSEKLLSSTASRDLSSVCINRSRTA
ncbi:hypothetical protein PMAYCL1PPCAC_08148, partial [Pristionchus mayeri]